ncbi:MAG: hypothetical protein RBQ97_09110 [Acholeplasma sp.]|jgi:hypothetical protein|nr:hypothetical protein [Acholeplasma sp.]
MQTNRFDKIRFFEDYCIVFDDCYSTISKKRNIDNYINTQASGVISQDNDIRYMVDVPDLHYASLPKDVENLDVINQLTGLKALKLYSSALNKIDISQMNQLRHLHIIEDEKLSNLNFPKKLESLYFQDFGFKNLLPLKSLSQLRELYIENSSKLQSIEGIENLTNLCLLSVDYCTKLKDIESISSLSKTLNALRVMECNKVTNFDLLNNLKELTHVNIVNSDSMTPIKLRNLEFVNSEIIDEYICNFKIEDGNLKPLLKTKHAEVFKFYSIYNLEDKDLPKKYVAYQDSKYTGKRVLLSDLVLGKDDPYIIWTK